MKIKATLFMLITLSLGLGVGSVKGEINTYSNDAYTKMAITVKGIVTDQDNEPLIGVNIMVKGTNQGTVTDAEGNFTLHNVEEDAVLTFSYIGFQIREIPVKGQTFLTVVLTTDFARLDEIIVTAYGEIKRTDFTGSATTITSKSIDTRPISNPLVALQGLGTGVQTTSPSGAPGSSPTIRVRGIGSYSASSAALIVVDGVEYTGGLANINPDDVESITVLKDAATIALYGSRGANGVVMVTTKKGQIGQVGELNVKIQYGTNVNGTPEYNTVGPGQYYELMWEAYKNSLIFGSNNIPSDVAAQIASGTLPRNNSGLMEYNGKKYEDIVQYLGNYNAYNVPNSQLVSVDGKLNPNAKLLYEDDLNWLDQASKTGARKEYGLTYSGGSGKTDYYTSLNYLTEEGWGLNSQMDRYSGRLRINSEIKDWLKTGANIFANQNVYKNASTGSTSIVNPFYFSRGIGPIYPVHLHDPTTGEYIRDENGQKIFDLGNMVAEYGLSRPYNSGRHAIAENLWNLDRNTRDFAGARVYVDIMPLSWLTLSTSFNPEITNQRYEDHQNTIVGDGAPSGRYAQSYNRRVGYTFNQTLNAVQSFKEHNITLLLGHENVSNQYESITGRRTGEGFADFYTFSNFSDILTLSSSLSEYTMESYFTRVNYNYDNKYYLSASLRRDGDSKMPPVNRWANFWSIGGAWRIEKESFFNADFVNLLKLRASYGRLGNNALGDIGVYPYQPGYGIGENNAQYPGVRLEELGSPDLRWEGQSPLDIGLDYTLFNGRIDGTIDYYHRASDGLLFTVRQPYHNGGTTGGSYSVYKNVGDMVNKGLEFAIRGEIIRNRDVNWSLSFNITTVSNEITKMPVETPEIVSSPYKRQVGTSLYDYYTRSFYGVDPDNGAVLYRGIQEGSYDALNPDIKIIGNDTLTYDHNLARQDFIGKSALPKAYGSIINNVSYKNFNFEFVLMYSLGGYVIDSRYSSLMSAGPANGAALHKDLLDGWRKPGDKTDIPRMDLTQTAPFGATSDRFITSSDYLSLSAVNISYLIPASIQNKASLKNARIYLSAENLWFITKRKGLNTLTGFSSSAGTGSYTMPRTLNMGINFGF